MIRSVGYNGVMGEYDWSAVLAPRLGALPHVGGVTDFKVTATAGYGYRVAAGVAAGHGIVDVSDASEDHEVDQLTSGTRYDTIVVRRDWEGKSVTPSGAATGGATTVTSVAGGSSASVAGALRKAVPVIDDPLALVKVTGGSNPSVQVVADLRVIASRAASVRSVLAMTGPPGTRYVLEPDGKPYVIRDTGIAAPQWEPPPVVIPPIPDFDCGTVACSFTDASSKSPGTAVITHNLGRVPKAAFFTPRLAASSPLVTVDLSVAAGAITSTTFTVVAKYAGPDGGAPYTGSLSAVDWMAY